MKTTITYLFDPLCGWCYGAAPMIGKLSERYHAGAGTIRPVFGQRRTRHGCGVC
jgi:protein-disulfide isomerase-like protein with CxxC motif